MPATTHAHPQHHEHAAHGDEHGGHDQHAGHDPEMFRRRVLVEPRC